MPDAAQPEEEEGLEADSLPWCLDPCLWCPLATPKGSSSLRNGVGRRGYEIEAQTLSEDALGAEGQSAFLACRKPEVQSPAAHICNPNSWEWRQEDPWLCREFEAILGCMRPCLKTEQARASTAGKIACWGSLTT